MIKRFIFIILLSTCTLASAYSEKNTESAVNKIDDLQIIEWKKIDELEKLSNLKNIFAGTHNDRLIIAGGITFVNGNLSDKVFHDEIYVGSKDYDGSVNVKKVGKLSKPLALGASVTCDKGLICLGGQNQAGVYSEVVLLSWNEESKQIEQASLPDLPMKKTDFGATILNDIIYIVGGRNNKSQNSETGDFWSLDLSEGMEAKWQQLVPWPGQKRAESLVVSQFNGKTNCVYVIGGVINENGNVRNLRDVYEFTPGKFDPRNYDPNTLQYIAKNEKMEPWRKCSQLPTSITGVNGSSLGQSHILAFGKKTKENNSKSLDKVFLYHTITDQWIVGQSISQEFTNSAVVSWDDSASVIRSPDDSNSSAEIWQLNPLSKDKPFGIINFSIIGLYLLALVGVGVFFSFRQKNTDDYFRGGQRLPWFVAGCSIFATMLSSITFIAIPAKAYMTDWTFLVINIIIVLISPFIIYCVLPFFRNINATSAYEYLEKRFNLFSRLFASASFLIYQIGRMAIVMYLTALPISIITSLNMQMCILIMGILSIIYCTLGGLEAVVWTDTIQTFVLLGGAIFSLVLIFTKVAGGADNFISIAASAEKFQMVNFDFSLNSYTKAVFWVIVVGGIGSIIVPYTSDMAVVQRYMSVSSKKQAQKAILTNAIAVIPSSIIFFGLGTALFVYYKMYPSQLDPTYPTDAVFPLFIARQLPIGVSGLVVAGIFAAAQSTISTGMNSTSTAFVTDFVRRFDFIKTDRGYLNLGRLMTLIFGALSTFLGLVFAVSDVESMWETSMGIIGLLGGAMCGLFLLGMFTTRSNGTGGIIGAFIGIAIVILAKVFTPVHQLLYAGISISTTMVVGYLASLMIPGTPKTLKGLTWFTLGNTTESDSNEKVDILSQSDY